MIKNLIVSFVYFVLFVLALCATLPLAFFLAPQLSPIPPIFQMAIVIVLIAAVKTLTE